MADIYSGDAPVSEHDIPGNSSPAPSIRPSWELAAERRQALSSPKPAAVKPIPAIRPLSDPSSAAKTAPPTSEPDSAGTTIRYDMAGNPLPEITQAPAHLSFGYSAGTPANVWPPPPGASPYGGFRNTSGEQGHFPPEIERLRWNWGAYFFPILWCKKHGLTTAAAALGGGLVVLRLLRYFMATISPLAYLGICCVYGIVYFAVQIYFGLNGHRIGWRNRHFSGGLDEYFKVQNAWMWWGLGINIFGWILLPILFMGALTAGVSAAHDGYDHGSYSQPVNSSSGASPESDTSGQ